MPHGKIMVLFSFLYLVTLLSCNNHRNSKINREIRPHALSEYNNRYFIDTSVILNNENLYSLLKKGSSEKMTNIYRFDSIPKFITEFIKRIGPGDFRLADDDAHWQQSDIVLNEMNLPMRKLLFFSMGKNLATLAYDIGGMMKSRKIVLMEIKDNRVVDFWCGNLKDSLSTINAIWNYLNKNGSKKFTLNTNVIGF